MVKSFRESSIELLKVIAIFLIVLSHDGPRNDYLDGGAFFIDVTEPSMSVESIIVQFFTSLGQVGNAIFIICSSFFLYGSKRVKRDKVYYLISSSIFLSLLCFIVCSALGFSISRHHLLYALFPIATGMNWFVGCYLIFYIIHPALNAAIDSSNYKRHFIYILLGMYAWGICTMVFTDAYRFFPLVQFIVIYLIVTFIKKYNYLNVVKDKALICLILLGFIGLFVHILSVNYISIHWITMPIMLKTLNPWILLISLSSFILFYNRFHFQNRFINYLSSLSLLIYLIDENIWVKTTFKPYLWTNISSYLLAPFYIVLITLIIALISFISCSIIASAYKYIYTRYISTLFDSLDNKIVAVFSSINDR